MNKKLTIFKVFYKCLILMCTFPSKRYKYNNIWTEQIIKKAEIIHNSIYYLLFIINTMMLFIYMDKINLYNRRILGLYSYYLRLS
jgi:Ca2+/Na+ antiporter